MADWYEAIADPLDRVDAELCVLLGACQWAVQSYGPEPVRILVNPGLLDGEGEYLRWAREGDEALPLGGTWLVSAVSFTRNTGIPMWARLLAECERRGWSYEIRYGADATEHGEDKPFQCDILRPGSYWVEGAGCSQGEAVARAMLAALRAESERSE